MIGQDDDRAGWSIGKVDDRLGWWQDLLITGKVDDRSGCPDRAGPDIIKLACYQPALSYTFPIINLSLAWTFFMLLNRFKFNLFEKFFEDYNQSAKQLRYRPGLMLCHAGSGNTLFAKVISRWHWYAKSIIITRLNLILWLWSKTLLEFAPGSVKYIPWNIWH